MHVFASVAAVVRCLPMPEQLVQKLTVLVSHSVSAASGCVTHSVHAVSVTVSVPHSWRGTE
jgi:hypothetical protein